MALLDTTTTLNISPQPRRNLRIPGLPRSNTYTTVGKETPGDSSELCYRCSECARAHTVQNGPVSTCRIAIASTSSQTGVDTPGAPRNRRIYVFKQGDPLVHRSNALEPRGVSQYLNTGLVDQDLACIPTDRSSM